MPRKKRNTKKDKKARASKRYEALPEWKKRSKQNKLAGIKSGTSDQWRDPKSGLKAR